MTRNVFASLSALLVALLLSSSQASAGSYSGNNWNTGFSFTQGSGWSAKKYTGVATYSNDCIGKNGYQSYKLDNKKFFNIQIFDDKGKECQIDKKDCKISFQNGNFNGLNCQFKTGYKTGRVNNDWCEFDRWDKCKVNYNKPWQHCQVVPTPAAASAGLALLGLMGLRRRRAA